MTTLYPHTVHAICARGLLDARTVRTAYAHPERNSPSAYERVRRAALELDLPPPPPRPAPGEGRSRVKRAR